MAKVKSMFLNKGKTVDPDSIINLQLLIESKKQSDLLQTLTKVIDSKLSKDHIVQQAQLLFQYKTDADTVEYDKKLISLLSKILKENEKQTDLLTKIESTSISKEDQLENKRIQEEQLKLAKSGKDRTSDTDLQMPEMNLSGFGMALAAAIGAGIAFFKAQVETIALFTKALVPTKYLNQMTKALASFASGISMYFDIAKAAVTEKISSVVNVIGDMLDATKKLFSGDGKILSSLSTVLTYVKNFFSTLIEPFKALIGFAKQSSTLFSPITKAIDFISGYASTFAKYVSKFSTIFKKLLVPLNVILTVWDTLKGAMEGFEKEGVVGAIKGAIKGFFNSLVFGLADLVKGAISWILDAIGLDSLSKLLDSFSFEDVFSDLVDALFWIPQQLQNLITSPIETIKSAISALTNIEIPKISFKIPFIDKEFSIGPFRPFSSAKSPATSSPSASSSSPANLQPQSKKQTNSSISPDATQSSITSTGKTNVNNATNVGPTNMMSLTGSTSSTNVGPVSTTPVTMTPVFSSAPTASNAVYNKSAEINNMSRSSVSSSPMVVSAPTNVVSQTSNISMPKHVRNEDSTYIRYLRNNLAPAC